MDGKLFSALFFGLLLVSPSFADLIVTGASGAKGEKGMPGDQGATGVIGDPGEVGETGATGLKGMAGQKGELGSTGSTGSQGEPGSSGNTGQPGSSGIVGQPGPPGITGGTGGTGELGIQGPGGDQGDTGRKGEQGPQAGAGQQGEPGDNGPDGEKGGRGMKGLPGEKGLPGLPGPKGEGVVDWCVDAVCPTNATCENTLLGFDCSCPAGYTYNKDSNTCDDINECLETYGNCDNFCQNTAGSYSCECREAGFKLSSLDKHSCIDIDECETESLCGENTESVKCVNTYGSYVCVDLTPIADVTPDAQLGGMDGEDMVNELMIIILVVWAACLTVLFIVIIICLLIRRQDYINEQKGKAGIRN
ncbi:uncharacterized protein [Watersipora subatra]|uniref:uncharacterized protein n=1 Tax=Watersipora subatra TaxID=2589382 RepID=UPI00355B7F8E